MSMFIRRRGRQVDDFFAMVPNESARDSRLSLRSRGVLTYLLSHNEGWNITTELVARDSRSDGVDGVRTSFTELEEAGYIRRVLTRDERGRWARWCEVYPYGDAPAPGGDADPEPIPDTDDEPVRESPALAEPVRGEPVHYRRPSTEDHSLVSVVVDAAATTQELDLPHSVEGAATTSHSVTPPATIPVVLQRKLSDMGVTDGTAWTAAWQAAVSVEWPDFSPFEAAHFPEEHLMLHLLQQQDRGQTISASRWLRFFLEDRQRRITIIKADLEQAARHSETPQEREDRLNRRLPPIWPDEPAPTTTTGERA